MALRPIPACLLLVAGLGVGCAEASSPGSAADTEAPTDAAAREDGAPWVASPDEKSVCRAYCEGVHQCLGSACAEGLLGPRGPFIDGCASSCATDPSAVDEAWALAPATCAEMTTILCQTLPSLRERCTCRGPVAQDGTVCGREGIVDQVWARSAHAGCGDDPACHVEWLILASDGTYRRAWRTPVEPDPTLPLCDAGGWAVVCEEHLGRGMMWLAPCDRSAVVTSVEMGVGSLRLGAADYSPITYAAPFEGVDGCAPVEACAAR